MKKGMPQPEILRRVEKSGYLTFKGRYNLNLIAIRGTNREAGFYDDMLCVAYQDFGEGWNVLYYPCTTDAGEFYSRNPILGESVGTARICPGQYRGAYQYGRYKDYQALVQRNPEKPITIWRDKNRDSIANLGGEKFTGSFSCHIHRAGINTTEKHRVGKYSAGCIVVPEKANFDQLIHLAQKQISARGIDTFTLTLLQD